jgi:hypothetical protein
MTMNETVTDPSRGATDGCDERTQGDLYSATDPARGARA